MDRKWKSGAVGAPPAAADNASDGYPTAGNPGVTPPTKPGPYWFYMVTEEILSVINFVGTAFDKNVITQLRDAISTMISRDKLGRGYLGGLTLANNAVDAVNDIDIAAGQARDSGDLANITLAVALTKQLDAAWAVGNNQGMRASGALIADGTYHIFLIRRPDTGVVDIAADTSAVGANIAANTNAAYTQKRRIGSILREAGSIAAFVQDGDYFRRKVAVLDVNATNPGVAAVSRALSVPDGINVEAFGQVTLGSSGTTVSPIGHFSDLAANDEAPSGSAAPLAQLHGITTMNGYSWFRVRTNASRQIRSRVSASDATFVLFMSTLGWFDSRGRDA